MITPIRDTMARTTLGLAALLAAASTAQAQGAQALARVESLLPSPTCAEARTLRFDERTSSLWRLSARDLLKARSELAALVEVLEGRVDGPRSPRQRTVTFVRRGTGRDTALTPEVDRELARTRVALDSVFRRLVRTRESEESVVFIGASDISTAELRQLSVRANEVIGAVAGDLFGGVRPPAGWLGVSISGEYLPRYTREGPGQLYCSEPVVESVEVGGPADKAGLSRGDTLLLLNGQPMRGREVRFAPLLQPGATVTFRTRRGGRTRDVPVIVERRPGALVASAGGRPGGPSVLTVGDSGVFSFSIGADAPAAAAPRGLTGATAAAPPPSNVWITSSSSTVSGGVSMAFLGGARFTSLSKDFADALGVTGGVLVADVGEGSPAADAGLREGDVVRLLNGTAVSSPLQISMAARQSRSLTFEVVRRGKAKTIEFKW